MAVNVEQTEKALIIAVDYESLDITTGQSFRQEVLPLLKTMRPVVLDLNRLRYVDSSGCGILISCLRQCKSSGGTMSICGLNKSTRALIEPIRLNRLMDFYDTRIQALEAIKP